MALTDNLISYYKLDEASGTRNDSHGVNHLGQAGTISAATGKINNGITNAGSTSNYLFDDSLTGWKSGVSDFTVSLWFKTSTAGVLRDLWSNTKNVSGNRIYNNIYQASTNAIGTEIAWVNAGNQGIGVLSPATSYADGNWHHIVMRCWNSGVANTDLWIDGASVGSAAHGTQTYDFSTDLVRNCIGGFYNYFTGVVQYTLTGELDEVGIWSRKITDAEVTQLYNSGAALAYPFATSVPSRLTMMGVT